MEFRRYFDLRICASHALIPSIHARCTLHVLLFNYLDGDARPGNLPLLYHNVCSLIRRASSRTLHVSVYLLHELSSLMLRASVQSFDTAMAQKSHFKMQMDGGHHEPRWTFPQLPWNTVNNPKYIQTAQGGKLLIDGWWAYLRKPVSDRR